MLIGRGNVGGVYNLLSETLILVINPSYSTLPLSLSWLQRYILEIYSDIYLKTWGLLALGQPFIWLPWSIFGGLRALLEGPTDV